jgi:hypothetical protein
MMTWRREGGNEAALSRGRQSLLDRLLLSLPSQHP